MINKSFDELRLSGKLPSPSGVGMRVLELTRQEDCSAEEVGQTIQTDPALTGRILKVANSTLMASKEPANTVSEATMRLGLRTVCDVALGFSLVSGNRTGSCKAFDFNRFWSESLGRAIAARNLAEIVGGIPPTEAFICSLLSRIGRLALAAVHPEEYSEVLDRTRGLGPAEVARAEREEFQIDHGEVAAAMLDEWGLPEVFGEAIMVYKTHEPSDDCPDEKLGRFVSIMQAADRVVQAFLVSSDSKGVDWNAVWENVEVTRNWFELSSERFEAFVEQVITQWGEWNTTLGIPAPGSTSFADLQKRASISKNPRQAEESGSRSKALSILLIHPDPDASSRLSRFLTSAEHQVLICSDGKEALRVAMEKMPQVLVAASRLPGMDGLELCRSLRSFEAGTRMYFIILSEKNDDGFFVEAFDAGVDDCVSSAVNPLLLEARIKGAERFIELQDRVERDKAIMRKQVADLGVLARRLRAASLTDSLTELPNRRFAIRRLEQEWASSSRSDAKLSAIMLDIDFFKKVNDLHGHDAGDEVLREVAKILRQATRSGEEPCRLGGEEFLVILKNTGIAGAARCAERIRRSIENHVISFGKLNCNVTVSLGVAERIAGMTGIDALLKASDEEVYRAKDSGRNRVCVRGMNHDGMRDTG